jgi:hypothetical protein
VLTYSILIVIFGAPGEIRTHDLCLRRVGKI